MGDKQDGLYYFQHMSSVKVTSVVGSSSMELWYKSLRHPSEKVVKLLLFVSRFREYLNKACEVCHRAKQPRESFLLSNNKTS